MTSNFDKVMKSYWENSHRNQSIVALTGASLKDHLKFLRVSLPSVGRVLCIGVGTGGWVKEMALGTQLDMWTLDISTVVKVPFCVQDVSAPEALPTGWFDLALSHWVSPHVNKAGMTRQIREVIRSLKQDGVFAVHYNEPTPGRAVSDDQIHLGKAGEMTLTREAFLRIVADAGGEATIIGETSCPEYKMSMVVAHCRRLGANSDHG